MGYGVHGTKSIAGIRFFGPARARANHVVLLQIREPLSSQM